MLVGANIDNFTYLNNSATIKCSVKFINRYILGSKNEYVKRVVIIYDHCSYFIRSVSNLCSSPFPSLFCYVLFFKFFKTFIAVASSSTLFRQYFLHILVVPSITHHYPFLSLVKVLKSIVQSGIASTSPLCHKKTDQRSNEKSPVCWSNERRNGRRKGGVVKK